MLKELVVTLRVPAGQHLYADPAPEGMIATEVVLDDGLPVASRPHRFPPSKVLELAGTGERIDVFEGDVEIRVPLVHRPAEGDEGASVTLAGEVRWQSCTDETCFLPASERFAVDVEVGRAARPDFDSESFVTHATRLATRKGEQDTK